MKNPFADATYKESIHRASSMRTYNNHIYIQFGCLLKNRFYRWPVHQERCCVQAFFTQSLWNLLNLLMLRVEFFR